MVNQYSTFKMGDRVRVNQLNEILKDLIIDPKNVSISLKATDQGTPLNQSFANLLTNEELSQIITDNGFIVKTFELNFGNHTLTIQRTPTTDEVGFQGQIPFINAAKFMATIQKHIIPYARNESIDKLIGDELAEFYRKREEGLCRLEGLSQKIITENEEYRTKIDLKYFEAKNELRDQLADKNQELKTEYQAKESALKKREEELEALRAEIDDRSSTHARRQIRQDLKAEIAKRNKEFGLTKQTNNKRIIIHCAFGALIGFLGFMIYISTNEFKSIEALYSVIKITLSSLGLAASIIYYIRWNDNWFKRHADEEFHVKRFELDIDRASWVVEMALEWKEEKGTEIPEELLNRITTNLFEAKQEDNETHHPSEDVVSALLGASSELNVNLPGVGSLKLDRKGTKKLVKKYETPE